MAEERPEVFYTNSINFFVSMFDFILDVGIKAPAPDGSAVHNSIVKIAMSPQHAKAVAKILQENVRAYEEAFGTFPAAPNPESMPKE